MLTKTKPWGGGKKNLKITSLPHENPNEFTIQYVTVQGTSSTGICLQSGRGKGILSGQLRTINQSLPVKKQPGVRVLSQISKETKILKMLTDELQYAGHTQEGSEAALINWILGDPQNYQLL